VIFDKPLFFERWRISLGYYVRIFSKSRRRLRLAELEATSACKDRILVVETGSADEWDQILVKMADGRNLCLIERDERDVSSLFSEEIDEFLVMLEGRSPAAGVEWARGYLRESMTIYAAQYFDAAFDVGPDEPDPADILLAIRDAVGGGIVQADGEGISNEQGYSVVLQFSEDATGSWSVALLNEDGTWRTGRIELGDPTHRAAFEDGRLPI
jgi:hypothetical protein